MNRLKQSRFEKGKTQIQLFKETGIWPSRISYIENAYMEPKRGERELLADALDVKVDWLFPRKHSKKE